MKMTLSNISMLSRLLFVWVLLQTTVVEAYIPEPDNVLYGTISLDGELVTASDTNMAVILEYDDAEIARYTFGDDPLLADRYLLKVTIAALSDTSFKSGDILQVQFKLDDEFYSVAQMVVAGRGTTTELNLILSSDELALLKETENTDSDGDGIPDQVEIVNGLNPYESADAALDFDGDTFSNLEEYLNGTDIQRDELKPLIIANAMTTINANGLFTEVSGSGAVAYDQKDGLLTPTTDGNGFYAPGLFQVLWTVADAAGNEASDTQTLLINPLVNFHPDQLVAEGSIVKVMAELNGSAASYPVTIPFTVSQNTRGDGDEQSADFILADGNIVISSGLHGSIEFPIIDDGVTGEQIESVMITMGSPINAVAGQHNVFVARITESNIAPSVKMVIEQVEVQTSIVVKGQGTIVAKAMVDDVNAADSHSFDWSLSDSALVDTDGNGSDSIFTIDSDTLDAGIYNLSVNVTDTAGNIGYSEQLIQVLEQVPVLSEVDTDGDGVADITDGYADADGDGIPQYLDAVDYPYALPAKALVSDSYLVETQVGLHLSLGSIARALGADKVVVRASDIVPLYPDLDVDNVSFSSGLENFRVTGLTLPGASISVVLPRLGVLPNEPSYTTLAIADLSWNRFVIDEANKLYSAPGASGYCPAPEDSAYVLGLVEGNWCVMLRLQDGGPNDADATVNQMIVHIGGVQGVLESVDSDPLDTDSDGIIDSLDLDDDGDLIPDAYEIANQLDPLDPSDALKDKDNDGLLNLAEYLLGTYINNPDTDEDEIADNVDNNPLVFDKYQNTLYSGQLVILPDMTTDGVKELGMLSVNTELSQVELELLDGKSQESISVLLWSDIYTDATLRVHVIDDMNGNGVSEVGLFGIRDSINNQGKPQMFVRDLLTGNRVNVFNWPANWKQTHAVVLSDMTGDGISEIAIQGRFKDGHRPQLVIKSGASTTTIDTFSYPSLFTDPKFYQHSDMNDDGVGEISIFGRLASNNKIQIKIASGADSKDRMTSYNFADKWDDISWLKLDDSNGDDIADWGLFGTNKEDGRPQLIVKDGSDTKGTLRLHAWPAEMQSATFFVIPDMNGDGVDEVAAAGLRSNARHQFQIQNGLDRNSVLANYNLNLNLLDVSYHVLPDLTGDDLAEIGFMGLNRAGEYELVIWNSDISQGELRVDNLGSDWAQAPSINSLGDSDGDGSLNLLISGQRSTQELMGIIVL
jgi:hypothetical protein